MTSIPATVEPFIAFAREHLDPAILDMASDHPLAETVAFNDAGLNYWWLPEDMGGRGLDMTESLEIVSGMSYYDAGFTFGTFLSILGSTMIEKFGPEQTRGELLNRLVKSRRPCSVLASEDSAGSDLTKISTIFRVEGDALVLNGDKSFSTNADQAELLVVLARNQDDPTDYRIVVIPRDTPGITMVGRWNMLGVRGSATYQVGLTDVPAPSRYVLNGNGVRVLEVGLNLSRTLIAACGIGIARRVRDLSLQYAATKLVSGQPLKSNAVFAEKLGQMEADIEIMRNQCRTASREILESLQTMGADPVRSSLFRIGTLRSVLVAKLACGQLAWRVVSVGSEMFGGAGYQQMHPMNKLLRDARYIGIVEGGEDVTRGLIYGRFVEPEARRS